MNYNNLTKAELIAQLEEAERLREFSANGWTACAKTADRCRERANAIEAENHELKRQLREATALAASFCKNACERQEALHSIEVLAEHAGGPIETPGTTAADMVKRLSAEQEALKAEATTCA